METSYRRSTSTGKRTTPKISEGSGGLLLDTHVLIWTLLGVPARLSRKATDRIDEARSRGRVLVSAMTIWEVAMLQQRQRITLSRPIEDWVNDVLSETGINYVDISPVISIDSTRLPDFAHSDPVDTILIATARATGSQLVTCDTRMIDYGRAGHVSVFDARPR